MAAALLLVLWICLCRFCGWIDETPDLTETTQNLIACEGIVCGIEYGKESQYFYLNHLKISTALSRTPFKLSSDEMHYSISSVLSSAHRNLGEKGTLF